MTPFNLQKSNSSISTLCTVIERINTPNPENPGNLSNLAYERVMLGLHDETWVGDFVMEMV